MSVVLYETPAPKIARIILNRPERRNAQDTELLYALNDAFDRAAHDEEIAVIVLAANGPHFSAGHDLREPDPYGALGEHETVGTVSGFTRPGAEGLMAREEEIYPRRGMRHQPAQTLPGNRHPLRQIPPGCSATVQVAVIDIWLRPLARTTS
jgi:hypothetical protein